MPQNIYSNNTSVRQAWQIIKQLKYDVEIQYLTKAVLRQFLTLKRHCNFGSLTLYSIGYF